MRKKTVLAATTLSLLAVGVAQLSAHSDGQQATEVLVSPTLKDLILLSRNRAADLAGARGTYLQKHPGLWQCKDFQRFVGGNPNSSFFAAVVGAPMFCPGEYADPYYLPASLVSDGELCDLASSSHFIEIAPGDFCEIEVVSPNFDLDVADDASECSHSFTGSVTVPYLSAVDITTLSRFPEISKEYSSHLRLDDLCRELIENVGVMLTDQSPVCPDETSNDPLALCQFPSLEVCDDTEPDCEYGMVDDDSECLLDESDIEYLEEVEAVRVICHDLCNEVLGEQCSSICGVGAHDLVRCYRDCDENEETVRDQDECEVECEDGLAPDQNEFILGNTE